MYRTVKKLKKNFTFIKHIIDKSAKKLWSFMTIIVDGVGISGISIDKLTNSTNLDYDTKPMVNPINALPV